MGGSWSMMIRFFGQLLARCSEVTHKAVTCSLLTQVVGDEGSVASSTEQERPVRRHSS